MAICPFAVRKLIKPGSNDPRIKVRLGIWHVRDGIGPSLYPYFNGPSGGIESHFYIRYNGVLEQYRDTAYQADANLDANDFSASVETEGFANGSWTPEQLSMSKRLMLWLKAEHDVPLHRAKAWNGSGFGYHTMWGAPSHWTPVAKSCPGPKRKIQFDGLLVPWLESGASRDKEPAPTPHIDAALKADTNDDRVKALRRIVKFGDDSAANVASSWIDALETIQETRDLIKDLRVDLKAERG